MIKKLNSTTFCSFYPLLILLFLIGCDANNSRNVVDDSATNSTTTPGSTHADTTDKTGCNNFNKNALTAPTSYLDIMRYKETLETAAKEESAEWNNIQYIYPFTVEQIDNIQKVTKTPFIAAVLGYDKKLTVHLVGCDEKGNIAANSPGLDNTISEGKKLYDMLKLHGDKQAPFKLVDFPLMIRIHYDEIKTCLIAQLNQESEANGLPKADYVLFYLGIEPPKYERTNDRFTISLLGSNTANDPHQLHKDNKVDGRETWPEDQFTLFIPAKPVPIKWPTPVSN